MNNINSTNGIIIARACEGPLFKLEGQNFYKY